MNIIKTVKLLYNVIRSMAGLVPIDILTTTPDDKVIAVIFERVRTAGKPSEMKLSSEKSCVAVIPKQIVQMLKGS